MDNDFRLATLQLDTQFMSHLDELCCHGVQKSTRGHDFKSLHGMSWHVPASPIFPLLRLKRTKMINIVHEILWMCSGSQNIKYLVDNGVHIWDDWADSNGDLGPVYGVQWRAQTHTIRCTLEQQELNEQRGYKLLHTVDGDKPCIMERTHDQLAQAIRLAKADPFSRRNLVCAWNPIDLEDMKLPCCHFAYQFLCAPSHLNGAPEVMDIVVYMRSNDHSIGAPYNLAGYALLLYMVAWSLGYDVGDVHIMVGDLHVYNNQLDCVDQMTAQYHALVQSVGDRTQDQARAGCPRMCINLDADKYNEIWEQEDAATRFDMLVAHALTLGGAELMELFGVYEGEQQPFIRIPVAV